MKKNIAKLVVVIGLGIIFITILICSITNSTERIPINNISILINRDESYVNNPNISRSELCNMDFEKGTYDWESPGKKQAEIIFALQLISGEMCIVENDNNGIIASIITDNGMVKNQCYLDWIPELVLEYGENILFKHGANLFTWKYNKDDIITTSDISNEYSGGKVYSYKNSIAFIGEDQLTVYKNGERRAIKTDSQCLGFFDDNTLVFIKDLPLGFVYAYKYDINASKRYNRRILHIPGSIIYEAAFSPDGKYMLYFSSNGEGGTETYFLDMNSYIKKRIDFEIDEIISIQWLNYSR